MAAFSEVNSHPHSGWWLDFALKGRNQKPAAVTLPPSENHRHMRWFSEDNKSVIIFSIGSSMVRLVAGGFTVSRRNIIQE